MMTSSELSNDSTFERAAAIVRDIYKKDKLDQIDHKLTACMAFVRLFQSTPGFNKKKFFERCEVGT